MRFFSFITFILFFIISFAHSQNNKSEVPAYASITSLMLSPEKIKEKIKDTENDKELEQGLKNKLLGQYRNAINSIEMATAYDYYALSYTQSLKSAPAEEEKVYGNQRNSLQIRLCTISGTTLKTGLTLLHGLIQEDHW